MTDRQMLELLRDVDKSLAYAGMVLQPPDQSQWNETHARVKAEIVELEKRTGT